LAHIQAAHGFAELFVGCQDGFRIIKVRGRFYNGFRARFRIAGFENS